MVNTVGSLTRQEMDLIVGSVLGDGYLRIVPGRKEAFLEVNHSIKAKEYVDWKYKLLKRICLSPPKERRQNKDLPKQAYRFYTRQHPQITALYQEFYVNGSKVIPKGFELEPLSLAIWYMDDGSRTKKGDVYLNSQQFNLDSQRRLLHALRLLKIRARLNKDKKYYRIRVYKESIPKLFSLIDSFIIPSMRYKLSNDPVET